jgi:hypothetical protein
VVDKSRRNGFHGKVGHCVRADSPLSG